MKTRIWVKSAIACACLGLSLTANAAFVDFSSLTSTGKFEKVMGPILTGGLSVTGGVSGDDGTTQPLTIANDGGNEIGIGVCGPADIGGDKNNLCDSFYDLNTEYSVWNGQLDELENLDDKEYITISEVSVDLTGSFLLGSFDNAEAGTVTYGGYTVVFQRTSTGATILTDSFGGSTISQFGPSNVWMLTLGGFDSSITSVTFTAGGCDTTKPDSGCTTDNDYLVAGASVVPIPAAAWLFGSAVLGIAGLARRRAAARV